MALIVPAAGAGERLGAETPKPYLEIAGKTILEHTLSKFSRIDELDEVIIATSGSYSRLAEEISGRVFPSIDRVLVVEGGSERQQSIEAALEKVSESIGLVAVHDAVRPFVDRESIRKCCERMTGDKVDGAVLAVPAKDTIKIVDGNRFIVDTPPREGVWQAQTPQVFKRSVLIDAYRTARKQNVTGTDDASLVEKFGGKVTVIEGTTDNFKITYPVDLRLATLLLTEAADGD